MVIGNSVTGLDFELVENVGYREFHGELLKDYWNLNHLSRNKFTYTLSELIIEYKIQSAAKLQTIVKYSGYLKFTKLLDCGNCARDFKCIIEKISIFISQNSLKISL